MIADMFRRANRDEAARAELPQFTTVLPDGTRHLLRGGTIPPTTRAWTKISPKSAYDALPAAIETWHKGHRDASCPAP